jgi:hypothetical protein
LLRGLLHASLTYLTILSTVVFPVVAVLWVRSYTVSDRLTRVRNGHAIVCWAMNGEITAWLGPTNPALATFEHRKRESFGGLRTNRIFERIPATVHFDKLGFAVAHLERIPTRSVNSTGPAVGFILPIWSIALVFGILPMRLVIRNTQTSAEWTRQREEEAKQAEEQRAREQRDDLVLPAPDFAANLPRRPVRTAAASMRRWR